MTTPERPGTLPVGAVFDEQALRKPASDEAGGAGDQEGGVGEGRRHEALALARNDDAASTSSDSNGNTSRCRRR